MRKIQKTLSVSDDAPKRGKLARQEATLKVPISSSRGSRGSIASVILPFITKSDSKLSLTRRTPDQSGSSENLLSIHSPPPSTSKGQIPHCPEFKVKITTDEKSSSTDKGSNISRTPSNSSSCRL